jgi:type IV secretion system protein TrbD
MSLKRKTFASSLNRPILLLGGERKPVIASALLSLLMVLSDPLNVFRDLIAFGIWLLLIGALRLMAKADPCLIKIYMARLKYKAYYPAVSRVRR